MFSKEQAKARIESMRDEHWLDRSEEAVATLPTDRRELVRCALDSDRHDRLLRKSELQLPAPLRDAKLSYSKIQQLGGRVLCELSPTDRIQLLDRIAPGKGAHIEAGFQALVRRPLEIHFQTRSFRVAKGRLLDEARAEWIFEILQTLGPLTASVPDLAGWLSHLDFYGSAWPWLLAGVIDSGGPDGKRTLDTLLATLRGEHETGEINQTVIAALLACGQPAAWEAVGKLLLAAQRQEGLRQSILESVDQGHPGAFSYMCRVILENDLCRFSSVVRAADVWFGLLWSSGSPKPVEEAIESALGYLDRPEERAGAVERAKPTEAYAALWAAGFEDLHALLSLAERAIRHKNPLTRYAAVHALARLGVEEVSPVVLKAIDDPDDRVAIRAVDYFAGWSRGEDGEEGLWQNDAFDALEKLWNRLPGARVKVAPALWPWTGRIFETSAIGSALAAHVTPHNIDRLIPHLARLAPHARESLAIKLGGREFDWNTRDQWPEIAPSITPTARKALVGLLGDAAAGPVCEALRSLYNLPVERDEELALLATLKRKNSRVRTDALRRALQIPDDRLLQFAQSLLDAAAEQRLAGLQVLRSMAELKRSPDVARTIASSWASSRSKLSSAEETALAAISDAGIERPRRDNAFGLLNPENLSKPGKARALPQLRMTDAAWEILASIALLIAQHKDRELPPAKSETDKEPILLGNFQTWQVSYPAPGPLETEQARCPFKDLVDVWLSQRADQVGDADGLELLRAWLALESLTVQISKGSYNTRPAYPKPVLSRLQRASADAAQISDDQIQVFLSWAMRLNPKTPPDYATAMLDSLEGAIAAGHYRTSDDDDEGEGQPAPDEPLRANMTAWREALEMLEEQGIAILTPAHRVRSWRLALAARPGATERWASMSEKQRKAFYSNHASVIALSCDTTDLLEALHAGEATEDDLLDEATHAYWSDDGNVGWLTSLGAPPEVEEDQAEEDLHPLFRWRYAQTARARRLEQHPAFVSASKRLTARLIELELTRGEAPTEASPMTRRVSHAGGAEVCLRCLAALGTQGLKRNPGWNDESQHANLTHLISTTLPTQDDTPERFAQLCKAHEFGAEILICLALFAPQWVRHVVHALGPSWTGFEDAALWIHAHTKDNEYRLNSWHRRQLEAAIAERTPLQPDERKDGAVDVGWFERVIAALGEARWIQVYESARFACSGAGHKRAQLFADAMLGKRGATERELMARIKSKRHQDSIRALGLVPLKAGKSEAKVRQAQVLARYKLMQEVRRTSRKHGGSMLQASEKRAVEIGMENLARSAGFPDPLRLQWAMERLDLADLAKGPIKVKSGDLVVTLAMTPDGTPELTSARKGKSLASIPPAAKKHQRIAELAARVVDLRRAGSRMRTALEQAMCRGDTFAAGEVAELWGHPILRPLLERVVLVGTTGSPLLGYPDRQGRALRDHVQKLEPLKPSDVLRLAHPHDFLRSKRWSAWQRECLAAERVQPFKQVFRELYVPTAAEAGQPICTRYRGQQVNPRQALALLGSRGWGTRGDGGVQRTFYKERITARLTFSESFSTPAEVEGLTVESIRFTPVGGKDSLPLKAVPSRILSESLRDLDLVVAVAHVGGVDPEASESTVELRAALVRETCALLKLRNVSIDAPRVRIKGELAEYIVHLGSASVQLLPGGHVWIVPVGAQHRGRLFLPFADNDPKTAEVVSKVLLLARDRDIQDPSILDQIRRFR